MFEFIYYIYTAYTLSYTTINLLSNYFVFEHASYLPSYDLIPLKEINI